MLEIDIEHEQGNVQFSTKVSINAGATGVFGPSGSGKTTLLHMVAGLLKPTRGRIVLDGRVLCDTKAGIFLPPEQRNVGLVFQEPRLFPHLSVRDNLLYGRRRMRHATPSFKLDQVVDLLGIRPLLERDIHALSGGEAQRISLGRTLLAEPCILLLDEPMSALDACLKTQIIQLLRRIKEKMKIPLLMVSHNIDEIMSLCSDIILVRDGAVEGISCLSESGNHPSMLGYLVNAGMRNSLSVHPQKSKEGAGVQHALVDQPEACSGPRISIALPNWGLSMDSPALVAVRPSDIIIARKLLQDISVRNQFPARVLGLASCQGNTLIQLDVSGVVLWAEVTQESAAYLEIKEGLEVMCLIKTNSWQLIK